MPALKIHRQLACIPLLFMAQALYGQEKAAYPPPDRKLSKQEITREKQNHYCKRTAKEALSSRMKRYPFNSSAVVQFISFDADGLVSIADGEIKLYSSDPGLLVLDTLTGKYISTVKPLSVREVVTLTAPQVDTLTDIFYNYGFAGPVRSYRTNECYSPRNAIIFRDNVGKAFAFIELCFECKETRIPDENILIGEMCDTKLDMIKALFRKAGIRYGI